MYAKLTEVATQGCLDSIALLSFKPLHANLGRRGEGNVMAEILAMRRREPEGPVIAEQSGGILRLVLANPPANALSIATMTALQAELGDVFINSALGDRKNSFIKNKNLISKLARLS